MRSSVIALLLIVCLLFAQLPAPAQNPPQAPAPATVVVPAGTVVPLTLVTQIKHKSSKPGDTIRASVAFPVTIGTQLAIPAGTYVEGTLLAPGPKAKRQSESDVQIHFTRLIFANGFSIALDATQTTALLTPLPVPASPQMGVMALSAALLSLDPASILSSETFALPPLANGWRNLRMAAQATPPSGATLPQNGPPVGTVVGISLGAAAAMIVAAILLGHRHGTNSDYIVHDAGWQFQMKLDAPLSLDTSRIAP